MYNEGELKFTIKEDPPMDTRFAISEYNDAAEINRQLDELISKPIYSVSPEALKDYFGKMGLLFAFNTVLLCGAGITSAKPFAPQIMDNLLRPVVIPNKDAIPYLLSVL